MSIIELFFFFQAEDGIRDFHVTGVQTCALPISPVFGGKLKRFDGAKAKAVPGVRHVVQIERGIAVVATGFWPAKLGREALELSWDEGALAALDSNRQREE